MFADQGVNLRGGRDVKVDLLESDLPDTRMLLGVHLEKSVDGLIARAINPYNVSLRMLVCWLFIVAEDCDHVSARLHWLFRSECSCLFGELTCSVSIEPQVRSEDVPELTRHSHGVANAVTWREIEGSA